MGLGRGGGVGCVSGNSGDGYCFGGGYGGDDCICVRCGESGCVGDGDGHDNDDDIRDSNCGIYDVSGGF